MSEKHISLEQEIMSWALSEEGFLAALRSLNTFDEDSLSTGVQLLEKYLGNVDCISINVLQVFVDLYSQLCDALERSVRLNNTDRTEKILNAAHKLQEIVDHLN